MKLYVYDHCPYCTRVRMILPIFGVEAEVITLLNDDEETPTRLIGKKMVPIFVKEDGTAMGESLDIIDYLHDKFAPDAHLGKEVRDEVASWLSRNGLLQNQLMMPRSIEIGLKEFETEGAIKYYQKKKEDYIGSFEEHLKNSSKLIAEMNEELEKLAESYHGTQFFHTHLSYEDIYLFPILRNLTMVKGLVYPKQLKEYVERLSQKGNVPLFFDRAV